MTIFTFNVIKVLGSAAIASAIAALWCPLLINILYKYIRSTKENSEIGIDELLAKLEYNAFSKIGKVASDYGVPYKIVEYYDNLESNPKNSELIQSQFDNFERKSFEKFVKILGE